MVRIQNKLGILEYHCMVLSRKNTLSQKRGRSFFYIFLFEIPTITYLPFCREINLFKKSPAKIFSTLFTKKFKFMQCNQRALFSKWYFDTTLEKHINWSLIFFSSQKRRSHHIKPYFKITLSKSHQWQYFAIHALPIKMYNV